MWKDESDIMSWAEFAERLQISERELTRLIAASEVPWPGYGLAGWDREDAEIFIRRQWEV